MCYSAEASFVASGVLAGTSIAISRLPKEKNSLLLAAVPAIFAVHQFIEGTIWLNQGKIVPAAYQAGSIYAYALIAYVFWPVFIPLAAYFMEVNKRQRILILLCQAVGLGTGLGYLLSIIHSPVAVSVNACSLSYHVLAPSYLLAPYLLAVTVPFLSSSRRGLVHFGLADPDFMRGGVLLRLEPIIPFGMVLLRGSAELQPVFLFQGFSSRGSSAARASHPATPVVTRQASRAQGRAKPDCS